MASTHLDKARSALPFLRWPSFGQNQRDISQIMICKSFFLRIVVIFTCDGHVGEVELHRKMWLTNQHSSPLIRANLILRFP